MQTAVYPGSFDPCTNGHLDIIRRASKLFDKVVVAVLINEKKTPLFSLEERVEMLKTATKGFENVEICSFSGLLANFMKDNGYSVLIKGLRAVSDYEYEFQMALTNRNLFDDLETVFLPCSSEFMFLSSSIVKEVAKYNGKLEGLVPPELVGIIKRRFGY
ncbi:MAG: pantetheine-phosphate adenylyltransferase [Clostridia bacterium]|nr:pantetheine-phosphate adenylyltransferase [Clostridia bacterium]